MALLPHLASSLSRLGSNYQLRLLSVTRGQSHRPSVVAFAYLSTSATSKPAGAPSVIAANRLSQLPSTTLSIGRSFKLVNWQQVRFGGFGRISDEHDSRKMVVKPSRYLWDHVVDEYHYYFMLGLVPCILLSLFIYVFVGTAELTELPDDYEPEEYEYHRHPITRAIAWFKTRYLQSEQEAYERDLAIRNEEYIRMMTKIEYKDIKRQESLLGDYRGYYFVPVNPRPVSQHHAHRQIEELAGDFPRGFQAEDPRELPKEIDAPVRQY